MLLSSLVNQHHAQDQESPWFFEVHYPDGSLINVDQPWILRNGFGLNISSYYGWITLRVPHSSPIVGKKARPKECGELCQLTESVQG